MFEVWMNSPDHRDNILREDFREVGIGASIGTYKAYGDTTVYAVGFGVRSWEEGELLEEKDGSAPRAKL